MVARFLEHYYRRRPVNATFTGVHDYDGQLPDWSPDGLAALASEMATLRDELSSPPSSTFVEHPRRGPSSGTPVDTLLARAFLDIQIDEVTGAHFQRRNPALFTGEALFGLISLVTRAFAPVASRVESVRARLARVPAFLADGRASLTQAVPSLWRARASRECLAAETFLDDGLPRYLHEQGVEREGDADLLHAAREGFAGFRDWLEHDVPTVPDTDPASCGAPFFSLLLRRGHFVTESVDSLRDRALAELAEQRDVLERDARDLDPDGWPAIQARLAADHPTLDDYVPTFEHEWQSCREAALSAHLVTWPDWPLRYVPIPSHTRDVAPMLYYLFYRSPAPFDPHVDAESLVPPISENLSARDRDARLRASNRSVIRLNHVIHHGAIGHHVQNHAAYRAASVLGRIAAVDCASRIGMFSAGTMAEGWACYVVDLMEEIGYLTPEERVSQTHTRIRQLARALLDIGLHVDGWPVDRGLRFWQETVGASTDVARGEVTRASMFPGTAIMYWLGTGMIHGLRRQWLLDHDGPDRLRRFHDTFLSHGSVPVALIARMMRGEAL